MLTSSLANSRVTGKSWPLPTSCTQPVSALSRSVSHITLYKSERMKGKTLQYRDKTIKSASTKLTSWSVQAEQTVGEQSWSFCVVTEVVGASQADHTHSSPHIRIKHKTVFFFREYSAKFKSSVVSFTYKNAASVSKAWKLNIFGLHHRFCISLLLELIHLTGRRKKETKDLASRLLGWTGMMTALLLPYKSPFQYNTS